MPILILQVENRVGPLLCRVDHINEDLSGNCRVDTGIDHLEVQAGELIHRGIFVEPGFSGYQGQNDDEAHNHYDNVLLDPLFEGFAEFEVLFVAMDLLALLLESLLVAFAELTPTLLKLS